MGAYGHSSLSITHTKALAGLLALVQKQPCTDRSGQCLASLPLFLRLISVTKCKVINGQVLWVHVPLARHFVNLNFHHCRGSYLSLRRTLEGTALGVPGRERHEGFHLGRRIG